jgi:signal transduction histidine kinase
MAKIHIDQATTQHSSSAYAKPSSTPKSPGQLDIDSCNEPADSSLSSFGYKEYCVAVVSLFFIAWWICHGFLSSYHDPIVTYNGPHFLFLAFMAADLISWHHTTKNSSKEPVITFSLVCNALCFVSYASVAYGYGGLVPSFTSQQIFTIQIAQWCCTMPTCLVLLTHYSSMHTSDLVHAIICSSANFLILAAGAWCGGILGICAIAVAMVGFIYIHTTLASMLKPEFDSGSERNFLDVAELQKASSVVTMSWCFHAATVCICQLLPFPIWLKTYLLTVADLVTKPLLSFWLLHGPLEPYTDRMERACRTPSPSLVYRRHLSISSQDNNHNLPRGTSPHWGPVTDLEAEYRGLQQALKTAQDEAHARERTFASICHELRNPLNGIIGLVDSILADPGAGLSEIIVKRLKTVRMSGLRMGNLVNDILDSSSIRNSALRLVEEDVHIPDLCEEVIELTRPLLKRGVQLMFAADHSFPTIRGDSARIKQILHNVLGNSSKFTLSGHVSVRAKFDYQVMYENMYA